MSERPVLFLVGFMGSGKSTVGSLLAEALKRPFIDLDRTIVERTGRSIAEIFREHGESRFREMEREALLEAISGDSSVIALGGGVFCDSGNRAEMARAGRSIWLDVPFEILCDRIESDTSRPLAGTMEQLRGLFETRLADYHKADVRVECGKQGPGEIVELVLEKLRLVDLA